MKPQTYCLVTLCLAAAMGARAGPQPPASHTPGAPEELNAAEVPPELTPPPGPVQLPPATPPGTDTCDGADCPQNKAGAARSRSAPVYIGAPAQRALAESNEWAENPGAMPLRDAGGRVLFPFSQSAPTIVCAPLHVCDIELQAGEVVQGTPHIGDSVRWKISPAISGTEEKQVTHLIIKPTESGLDTNLIVPTDRHTYHIRLVSSGVRYVSSVAFFYPDEQEQSWADAAKAGKGGNGHGAANPGGGDLPTVAVNRLNFNYKIAVVKGKPLFKALRAMDDGYHTYISMNEDIQQLEAPVLVGISPGGQEQIVNYRLKGNIYVIDGTVAKMALISGAGRDQQRIELTRDACRNRGWLGICWDAQE